MVVPLSKAKVINKAKASVLGMTKALQRRVILELLKSKVHKCPISLSNKKGYKLRRLTAKLSLNQ